MGAEQSSSDDIWGGSDPQREYTSWMRNIPDTTSLKDITIPGTHQSMSIYGGALVACQSLALCEQYRAGIRYVDIRCRDSYNDFPIYHGRVNQRANFSDVLRSSLAFLQKNPTETIVMSVNNYSHKPEGKTESFEDTFERLLADFGDDRFWLDSSIPMLGQVRGKIVILRRFSSDRSLGIPFGGQKVKDDWTVKTILPCSINPKLEGIKSHLDEARSSSRSCFYITFCSGVSSGAYPNAVADRINIHVRRYAEEYRTSACLGIVVMDFPGWLPIHDLFMTNAHAADQEPNQVEL